jgi:glycosyltransferase involved in cell wall biosynthesis
MEPNTEQTENHSCQPTVSVIIPCYNQGHYVDEAVDSVLAQTYPNFEIVVVDDGSTDESTIRILDNYHRPKTKLIRTENQGLASARNNGIAACTGKYVLPLDADDKIHSTYLQKAVDILEKNADVGIVYCKAELFGEASGPWTLREYQFPNMLHENVIFCSAVFRRSDWAEVNGYKQNMIYGWEDFDFWLSLIEMGRQVVCIPETLFLYRKQADSMITSMTREKAIYSYTQLFNNHPKLYAENIGVVLANLHNLTNFSEYQQEQISNLKQHMLELQTAIQEVESSSSWKVTKPLRALNGILRKIRSAH